jgi:hypothetical protein
MSDGRANTQRLRQDRITLGLKDQVTINASRPERFIAGATALLISM